MTSESDNPAKGVEDPPVGGSAKLSKELADYVRETARIDGGRDVNSILAEAFKLSRMVIAHRKSGGKVVFENSDGSLQVLDDPS